LFEIATGDRIERAGLLRPFFGLFFIETYYIKYFLLYIAGYLE